MIIDALAPHPVFFLDNTSPWVYRLLSEVDWNSYLITTLRVLFWWTVISIIFALVVWPFLARILFGDRDDDEDNEK